jgi:DNA (cytosine-5)-methyltransferase 1
MNYLSVCSGIEAATVAWHEMGWTSVGFSEIEKFPSELLNYHYPNVTNYGDMTKFKEWNINEPVNLLVGGTPCQSFSVAGLRKGLEDPRGNLMLTYLAMADHFKPKWLLWENVPGVLSSNGGRDFAALLQGLAKLGYGFAYRILDAQYFGVPQRRRRVFVVGCFGDWRSATKVLFESESLCRNITPRRSEEQKATGTLTRGFGDRGYDLDQIAGGGYKIEGQAELANCLTKSPSSYAGANPARGEGNPIIWPAQTASTLNASFGSKMGLENQHINQGAPLFTYGLAENTIGRKPENGGNGTGYSENIMYTLNATGVHGVNYNMRVRRLTPIECERLQGFPDNYTNTPTSSDSTRYRALGNSMAVPVMKWIGEKINKIEFKKPKSILVNRYMLDELGLTTNDFIKILENN